MTEWYLIRHGRTYGNTQGRYIGCRTDEPLCEEGVLQVREKKLPPMDRIFASPMLRCIQTAELLWPGAPYQVVEELRECDFGEFENRNHQELQGDPRYQAWIDSGGCLPFPGGESARDFRDRCCRGFCLAAEQAAEAKKAALVVHGGTIMAILERYGSPHREYFDFQVKNVEGYVLTPAEETGLWNYRCLP